MPDDVLKILDFKIKKYIDRLDRLKYDIYVCEKMGHEAQKQRYQDIYKEVFDFYLLLEDFKSVLTIK